MRHTSYGGFEPYYTWYSGHMEPMNEGGIGANKPPFHFRERYAPIDWASVKRLNLKKLIRDGNTDTLEVTLFRDFLDFYQQYRVWKYLCGGYVTCWRKSGCKAGANRTVDYRIFTSGA